MSEENVEIIRECTRRWNSGEAAGSIMGDVCHADLIFSAPEGWEATGPVEGWEAIAAEFDRFRAAYPEQGFTDVDVVADKADWIVCEGVWKVDRSASGMMGAAEGALAVRFKENRIAEWHFRWNRDDALEAAGLSE